MIKKRLKWGNTDSWIGAAQRQDACGQDLRTIDRRNTKSLAENGSCACGTQIQESVPPGFMMHNLVESGYDTARAPLRLNQRVIARYQLNNAG